MISKAHTAAPATVSGDFLSERHVLEKSKNRKILLSILSNIQYLARQALPERMSEENSNFHHMLNLGTLLRFSLI